MARVYFFVSLLCFISSTLAKIFTRCELITELRRQGFPEYLLRDVICLIEAESLFQTNIKSGSTWDGSFNWGLFQINDRYWCNAGGTPGKRCNVRCEDLLLDDITAAAYCAQVIISQHGLSAWLGWLYHCKDRWLPPLDCTPRQPIKVFFDFV